MQVRTGIVVSVAAAALVVALVAASEGFDAHRAGPTAAAPVTAQVGGAGVNKLGVLPKDSLFFFATIDKVKLRRQVVPGDKVRFVIKNLRVGPRMLRQSGIAYVGEEVAAEAEWMCVVGAKS